MFNYVVVGAGLSGAVIAERIANQLGKKVLVIEKRNHIGGNCYDFYDDFGILIHKYGPHIFHTNNKRVWDYLSQFTKWNLYYHKVLGVVDGKKVPIPFNLNSLNILFPESLANKLEYKLIKTFGFGTEISILNLKETTDSDLKFLADYIYKNIFYSYTLKQWGKKPEEIDFSVTARVPIRVSRDDRYFQDKYQGIPKYGYAKLFEKILEHPNIKLLLNADCKEIIKMKNNKVYLFDKPFKGKLIYTGEIDYFFDYKYGKLLYRSIEFKFETFYQEYFQEVGTVNYPNDYDFTRITEFKHLTSQKSNFTTIVKEFPRPYSMKDGQVPCYPVLDQKCLDMYEKYKNETRKLENVIFLGRLAEYKYYNMDQVVEKALEIFETKISS